MNKHLNDVEILSRYQAGETGPAIAKSVGCRVDSIYDSLRRSNCERRKQVGSQHVNWRGGVTDQHRKLRSDPIYRLWQQNIFTRDHFDCQLCRKHGGILHAHHIIKKADDPTRIFDTSNGITLCDECHNRLITGKEKKFARLFAAAVKVGRPVSVRIFQLIYRNKWEVPPQKCECGCGKWTRILYGLPNKFIRGHQGIGRKKSEELRQRMSEAQRFKDNLIARAQSIYDSGKSTIQVAKELNVSTGWVKKVVPMRSTGAAQRLRFERDGSPDRPQKDLPLPLIISEYLAGAGVLALSAKHNVSHMTIRARLKEAKVYRPLPSGVTRKHFANR